MISTSGSTLDFGRKDIEAVFGILNGIDDVFGYESATGYYLWTNDLSYTGVVNGNIDFAGV